MNDPIVFIELTGFNGENSIRVRFDKIEVLRDMKDYTIVTTNNAKFSVTQTPEQVWKLGQQAYEKGLGL